MKELIYRAALCKWGPEKQLAKLAEEAAELSAAAARNLTGCGNEAALANEIADVEIMIEQFRQNGMDKLIDFWKAKKLARLAERLGVVTDGVL
ncbi:hypothetical protein JRC42_19655 [Escherichia albertii]|uniref:hypothetical protein n=1 Tax=Escherichia albertii TaxID=208962 RepID=UPI00195BB9BD|nr:hypothetical protein [Escherichia albertii]QST27755.1 hypothetical protein JRC42_19655 [Escherichia albertii]QST37122.1 hypothetical protein JRC46_19655 [Escherichia albertii]